MDRALLRFAGLSLIGALVPMLALVGVTLMRTGGIWEYALDDVYIHLAMSEQLAQGGYGVNPGEYASASSSILYSYLLAPFVGSAFHVWWPLVLGIGGLVGAAVLWGRVLWIARLQGAPVWMLVVLALGAPLFMHHPAMALIGMEHMLHIVAALLVLNGLLDFAREGRIGWMLVVGVVANPLLRFEGMAIALLACGILFFGGRQRAGLVLLGLTALPLAAHFWHMSAIGLDMLPNSVNAKAAVVGGGDKHDGGRLARILFSWRLALYYPTGRMLIGAVVFGALGLFLARHWIKGVWALIGWAAVLAAFGHVTLGAVGDFFRYEPYVWTFFIGAFAVLVAFLPKEGVVGLTPVMLLVGLFWGGVQYPVVAFTDMPNGSAGIYAQQRQMGRFVDDYWQAPVAVNDLGHVAYGNPYYVLDMWGLAFREALEARLRGHDPLWMDRLAQARGVRLAMLYKHWFVDRIPPSWVEVAELQLTIPQGTLGGRTVTFYATSPAAVDEIVNKLRDFGPSLPETVKLKILDSGQ